MRLCHVLHPTGAHKAQRTMRVAEICVSEPGVAAQPLISSMHWEKHPA